MILKIGNKSISNTLESIWVEVQRGSIPAGVTPSALVELKIQTGVTPPTPPSTPWLLATGIWNDGGEWVDTEFWID
jgi:hypothetical protein